MQCDWSRVGTDAVHPIRPLTQRLTNRSRLAFVLLLTSMAFSYEK